MITFTPSRSRTMMRVISVALVVMLVLVSALAALPTSASTVGDCAAKGPNWEAYLIRYDDTLTDVARLYGVSVADLAAWNNISNSNLIYWGTYLCVDLSLSSVIPNPVTGVGIPCASSDQGIRYGDTLSGIAYAFGTSIKGISQVARIANPDLIFAGEVILIPPFGVPSC
ncbi:MAG: LysM domain-containing protein [Anaerolineae bacterium]|nr:LysM domain-containing protein [Anaerolineae bacterium]NUQ02421.1 LysM peptidoglycan-binding domain-containing protein [Anaerolineae bacterium]